MINKNRILKRNKLIKKLFIKYSQLTDDIKIPCHLRIQKRSPHGSHAKFYSSINNKIINTSVTICPDNIKNYIIKKGYSNSYYSNRHEKLHFVLHNYKKALRFAILHEIGHIIFCNKYNLLKIYKSSLKRKEKYADSFALRYLNKAVIK
jgi:Zn-dependent peptidase ImmA (M78 family)